MGLAFAVYEESESEGWRRVDPKSKVWTNGDFVLVEATSNLPGILQVYTVGTSGKVKQIRRHQVLGLDVTALGPLEFYGAPGTEVILFRFFSCRPLNHDEDLRISDFRGPIKGYVHAAALQALPLCAQLQELDGFVATEVQSPIAPNGGTMYAVERIDAAALRAAKVKPVTFRLELKHRANAHH